MGNPAKVVRIHASERTMVENHTIIVREEMAEPELPADIAAAPVADAESVSKRERGKKRERVIVLSTGPYLPITGALPLRFSSSRRWPAPVPKDEPARDEATPVVATATPPESHAVEIPAEPATTTVDHAAPPAAVLAAAPTPSAKTPVPTLLTADMVLGFLGDLPRTEARVSVRFEPALPPGASRPAGLGTLSP